jgi:nitrite reductase/ring-hydroxylating ferredoxin subunit
MAWIQVATVEALGKKQSAKFRFRREGIMRDGFVALFEGKVVVYENICRHLPITIDYGDNRFFTGDGKNIICQTHGAVYEPLTGLCFQGPCEGSSLFKVPFENRDGAIFIESED